MIRLEANLLISIAGSLLSRQIARRDFSMLNRTDRHSVEYRLYMRSFAWKMRRINKLKAAGHRCENCSEPYGLQVHHLTYARLGCELDSDLVVLCRWCHANE